MWCQPDGGSEMISGKWDSRSMESSRCCDRLNIHFSYLNVYYGAMVQNEKTLLERQTRICFFTFNDEIYWIYETCVSRNLFEVVGLFIRPQFDWTPVED